MDKHTHFIIFVDDDPDDREVLKEALQEAGSDLELIEASDGEDALRKLNEMKTRNERPCLMILDINMPGMSGRDLAIAILLDEELKNIPLVMFSVFFTPADKQFFEGKNIELIEKPYGIQELVKIASKFLTYCNLSID